ncbi:MAG: diguanylate cyclase [Longicatena sp.]
MEVANVMKQIIDLRFSDEEKTYSLCLDLLAYVKNHPDSYQEAFAYTYLGDYYIGKSNPKQAILHLQKAKEILKKHHKKHRFMATVHSFLGIAFDIDGDEHGAISNYLDGMQIAKENQEYYIESITLNNLAVIFQKHGHANKALEYFLKANEVQKNLEYFPSRPNILGNIGDMYLQIGNTDKALAYYRESEFLYENVLEKDFYHHRNRCCYLAAIDKKEEARIWAKKILEHDDFLKKHCSFGAFDNFNMLCLAMLKIKDRVYAHEFLTMMQNVFHGNTNELQLIEEYTLTYALLFHDEKEHNKAYYQYYEKTQEYKKTINHDIAKSMKDKIYLNEIVIEKRKLVTEQRTLEKEASLDETTAIYNRRYMEHFIKQNAHLIGKNLGVAMFDVDYFKEFNDSYGHHKGDYALRSVADCLKQFIHEGIHPCRYGGDEFICFFDHTSQSEIEDYICKIRTALHQKNVQHESSPCSDRLTLSIGYAFETLGTVSVYDLLIMADEALYESKLSGRNMFKKKGV